MPDRTPLTVVGDALLDRDVTGSADRLAPDAPVPVIAECAEHLRPGGAALAACLAARDGREVTLITGAGDDEAGRALRELLPPRVRLVALPLDGPLPEKTRVLAGDRPVVRLDRGGAGSRPRGGAGGDEDEEHQGDDTKLHAVLSSCANSMRAWEFPCQPRPR